MNNIVNLFGCLLLLLVISCKDSSQEKRVGLPSQSNPWVWIDYRLGALPPEGSYDAIDSLVKKYKLNYRRVEAGCDLGDEEIAARQRYDSLNQLYFTHLKAILGNNWKAGFDAELQVLDSMNRVKMGQREDHLHL